MADSAIEDGQALMSLVLAIVMFALILAPVYCCQVSNE